MSLARADPQGVIASDAEAVYRKIAWRVLPFLTLMFAVA